MVNGEIDDDYRIDYLKTYLISVSHAIEDGVDVRGYYMWSPIEIVSCSSSQMSKRYDLIYVNYDDASNGDGARTPKKSFY